MTEYVGNEREIEAREKAATAGPWTCHRQPWGQIHPKEERFKVQSEAEDLAIITVTLYEDQQGANGDFIAHARSDVPYLLDRVAFLRDLLLRLIDGTILPEEARYALQEPEGSERAGSQVAEE